MAEMARVETFVRQQLAKYDASHDWEHIERVRKSALDMAQEESRSHPGKTVNLLIVELAALLHDVGDSKYSGDETATKTMVTEFLTSEGYAIEVITAVIDIIDNMSFRKERQKSIHGTDCLSIEFGLVQDADRLDALGAIGIARCLTYGGAKGRALYNPTAHQDPSSTLGHFYDKLLKLKTMMKTDAGRQRAAQRHQVLESFLETIWLEIDGKA